MGKAGSTGAEIPSEAFREKGEHSESETGGKDTAETSENIGYRFALIFEKGTGVIEKTYQRTKLEQDYQVRQYMADVKQNSKSLRSFSKKARDTGTKNLLLSGVSGIGMGVLGIGLPDIPV